MSKTQWNPGTLLETSGYYWKTCVLHTGVKLDIFSILEAGSLLPEEVVQKLHGDLRGVSALLNALAAMDLLEKRAGRFSNTDASAKFLSKNSPEYIGFMIMHHHHLMGSWSRMDEAVLDGKPMSKNDIHTPEEQRENFLMGMFNLAMSIAPALSKELDLGDCTSLLDLGGGPGTYAIHFCLANPGLSAKIYDLPTTRPFAEKTIERFGLSKRIGFLPGDYVLEEFRHKGLFDAVWLSHILHGEGPEDAEKVLGKAVSALKPGGKIFIHDFILDNTLDGPLFPALFSLNMLVRTESGQSYSEEQLRQMLEKYGIREIKRLGFRGPTDSSILSGRL